MTESGKTPGQSVTTMVGMMMPVDANVAGDVFRGTIMRLMGETGSIVAFKHARSNSVTA